MKRILIIFLAFLPAIIIAQDTICTIPVPPVGHDTVYCFNNAKHTSMVYFIDYADIDSTVWLKHGPSPGDKGFVPWYFTPIGTGSDCDSLELGTTIYWTVEGTKIYRQALWADYYFPYSCWSVYNTAASADSSIYIIKY